MLEARKSAATDSSVVVSIQEILRLEAERLEAERKAEKERALLEVQRQAAEAAEQGAAEREVARQLERVQEECTIREARVAARKLAAREAELAQQRALFSRKQAEFELARLATPEKPKTSPRRSREIAVSMLSLASVSFFGVRHYEQKLAKMGAQHQYEMAALEERLVSLPRESTEPPSLARDLDPSSGTKPRDLGPGSPREIPLPITLPKSPSPTEKLPKSRRPGVRCPEGDPMCVEP